MLQTPIKPRNSNAAQCRLDTTVTKTNNRQNQPHVMAVMLSEQETIIMYITNKFTQESPFYDEIREIGLVSWYSLLVFFFYPLFSCINDPLSSFSYNNHAFIQNSLLYFSLFFFVNMKEQNSFIQYISTSANHIFKRRCHQKPIEKPAEVQPYNVIINRSLSNMTVSTLESCSLSDDDDEYDENDFTPTPSTSSCTLKYANREEPWRLNPSHFNGDEYFFQDRDEKHQTDDTSDRSISIERYI